MHLAVILQGCAWNFNFWRFYYILRLGYFIQDLVAVSCPVPRAVSSTIVAESGPDLVNLPADTQVETAIPLVQLIII